MNVILCNGCSLVKTDQEFPGYLWAIFEISCNYSQDNLGISQDNPGRKTWSKSWYTDPETFKYTTCTVRYGTLSARYGTVLARYGTLLARYGTVLARYGTLLARYGSFLARYALLKLAARYANEVGVVCTLWLRINCTIRYFCSLNYLIHEVDLFTNYVSICTHLINEFKNKIQITGSVIV